MKTTLITGATSGFGKSIAEKLAKNSHRLIITGRRRERLIDVKAELEALGTEVYLLHFDIRNREDVRLAIAGIPSKWQNIDILINNAGLALGKDTIADGDIDDWDTMLDTNVKGLLYVTKNILPLLKKSENGHIINIGSIAGTEVYPKGNIYCASKHAVDAISKALRLELLNDEIRVSQIRPGLADTEFSLVRYKGDQAKAESTYHGFEALLAEDIARIAEFIIDSPAHVCINDIEVTPTAQANATSLHKNS